MPRKKADATKGDVTRDRIKDAVIHLVATRGRNALRIQDICRKAEITHGGFYFHYKNKEEILCELAGDWMRAFKQTLLDVPGDDDLLAELRAMMRVYVTGYVRNLELTRIVYAMDAEHSEVRNVFVQYQYRWWARLEERFRRARAAAGLPTGEEVILAHSLTAALEGLCVDAYLVAAPDLAPFAESPDRLADHAANLWHRAVLGSA